MENCIDIDSLPEFDASQYLNNEEDIAYFLNDALQTDNPAYIADALGVIARARGMTEIAKASGISRAALYKALRPGADPRFETISRVCTALGVKLTAQPMQQVNA